MDMEKVIRIIDELIFEAQKSPTWKAENALRCLKKELLNEQDPIEPELEGGGSTWWYVCGECHGAIDVSDIFCRHCGRQVKQT